VDRAQRCAFLQQPFLVFAWASLVLQIAQPTISGETVAVESGGDSSGHRDHSAPSWACSLLQVPLRISVHNSSSGSHFGSACPSTRSSSRDGFSLAKRGGPSLNVAIH
jgi:hypothetical protein